MYEGQSLNELEDFKYNPKIHGHLPGCKSCIYGKPNLHCPHYSKCPYVIKNEYTANTIINKFKNFTELIFYKTNFYVPEDCIVNDNVDRTRKWILNENGVLCAKDENVKLEDLNRSLKNSRKRALDNVYGYVLCNDWDYFVTVTFKHGKKKKLSDKVVKYQWQKFRQQLQYRYPDIKIFLVPEDTPTGNEGMHFHGFFGNADLDEFLTPARNNKKVYNGKPNERYGEFLYTAFGDPVFNFLPKFVNIGFTTIVKLKEKNQLKLVNYITKYMLKGSSNFDYNENSYLRTYNLDFKDKQILGLSNEDKFKLVNNLDVECYKSNDRMEIYRI